MVFLSPRKQPFGRIDDAYTVASQTSTTARLSQSDPYVTLVGLSSSANPAKLWGRTRTIENDLNPVFSECFNLGARSLEFKGENGGKISPLAVRVRGEISFLGSAVALALHTLLPSPTFSGR